MFRVILLFVLFLPAAAFGQTHQHSMMGMMEHPEPALQATQAGQGAFAAIQEIVAILEADPKTDWSKVDIEALRQHLIDMDNVTLRAQVKSEPVDGGMKFLVSGDGPVKGSIQRMVMAHATTMNGVGGWNYAATETPDGAALTVLAPSSDAQKLKALGFIGILTVGMHHQMHHMMLARGQNPHD